jgi:hypothetical protein
MNEKIKVLDVVALLEYIPGEPLQPGQVGTIVEQLAESVYEVEFADSKGRTITTCALESQQLLRLTHELVFA